VLDRPQPRRNPTLAARWDQPRGDPRAARLHARARAAHIRRPTLAGRSHSSSL